VRKRGKRTAHSFFMDLMSSKEGKTRGFFDLRVRNGPKKESALAAAVYF